MTTLNAGKINRSTTSPDKSPDKSPPSSTKPHSEHTTEEPVLAVGESIAARRQHIDELYKAVVSLSRHIDASTYQLLVLLREFDERAGWLKWGSTDCAHWLAWRCDIGLNTAREKVRVAHALKLLPETSAAFSKGHLSYSKARAITRVATDTDEADFLKLAARVTVAHLEQHCRQRRNASCESTKTAQRANEQRFLRSWRDHERGVLSVTIELPLEKDCCLKTKRGDRVTRE